MKLVSLVFVASLPSAALAFVPTGTFHRGGRPQVPAFTTRTCTQLQAEGGAPQYDKIDAVLRQAEVVGEGTVMLHIDVADKDAAPLGYQPGHVLALEIEDTGSADSLPDEKTEGDTRNNGGWMRGPYTVSRATDKSIDVMIRVVGNKSRVFASAEPGTPLKFGGKFKVPIVEGVSDNAKRVVLLSTGVGIGPCVGAIEKFLSNDDDNSGSSSAAKKKVDLYASFRTEADVPYRDHLDGLVAENSDTFGWVPVVTDETGRISASEESIRRVTNSKDSTCSVTETHYHLIGNGQMVNEWKAGLLEAGVPEEMVTMEAYFNHKAEASEETIRRIADVVSSSALSPVA